MLAFLSELNWSIVFLSSIIGTGISILINLTGVGGGVLVIPILSLVFNLPPVSVVGTTSMYVTFSKFFSSVSHIRSGTVDWQTSLYFLYGAVPGVLLTTIGVAYTIVNHPQYSGLLQQSVYYATIVLMVIACLAMLKVKQKALAEKNKPFLLVVSGFFIGVIMGATGVGGGVLIIPALSLLTHLSIKQIVSGSLIIALIISGVTGIVYSQSGQIHVPVLIGLLVGSVAGVYVSNMFRHSIPDALLNRGIVVLIIISAFIMLLRGAPLS